MRTLSFTLNGKPVRLEVDETRKLLWVLREDLALTGTKYGCGEAVCGACTVVVGGQAVRACTMRVGSVEGREVTTIEGLAKADVLHPVQDAFARHGAFQCGFCTPGLVMGAYALLLENPKVGRAEAAQKLEGHLCRCGANSRVLDAVESAAAQMKGAAR